MNPTSSGAADAPDAIELIKQDHRKVQMLFGDFEALRNRSALDPDAKLRLVREICAELSVHAQIEEEILYPAIRQAVGKEDLVDAAEDEHAEAKALIRDLCRMQADDTGMDAAVVALAKVVMHHVQEEERDLLTAARGELAADELGRRLSQRQEELLPRVRQQIAEQ